MNNVQKLVVLRAMKKRVEEAEGSIAPVVAAEMRARFPHGGSENVVINDMEVATYKVERPRASEGEKVVVRDMANFDRWFKKVRKTYMVEFIEDKALKEALAAWWLEQTGEVPEGCVLEPFTGPTRQNAYPSGVKFEKVAEALGAALPETMTLALEESHD